MMRPVLMSLIAAALFAPAAADACAMAPDFEAKAPLMALMDEIDQAADEAMQVAVDAAADMVTKSVELSVQVQAPPPLAIETDTPSQDGTADAAVQTNEPRSVVAPKVSAPPTVAPSS